MRAPFLRSQQRCIFDALKLCSACRLYLRQAVFVGDVDIEARDMVEIAEEVRSNRLIPESNNLMPLALDRIGRKNQSVLEESMR